MKKEKQLCKKIGLFAILMTILLLTCTAYALQFEIEPAGVKIGEGYQTSIHIYVNGASNLISMGAKISFDPAVLEAVSATKNTNFTTGWVMDADGNLATTNDQYTTPPVEIDNAGGSVTMIGGRITGTSTTGLSGRVLLGTIVFKGKANGASNLNVDLGRYHPQHPTRTFDNFVSLDKTVDEPTNADTVLGSVCVTIAGDTNGDGVVNILDKVAVRNAFGQTGTPGWIPADVNYDGVVNILDKVLVRNNFGQSGSACQ